MGIVIWGRRLYKVALSTEGNIEGAPPALSGGRTRTLDGPRRSWDEVLGRTNVPHSKVHLLLVAIVCSILLLL